MKQLIFIGVAILLTELSSICQEKVIKRDSPKIIRELKNKTFEIKEFTFDSVLIYKGILSSVDPDVRNGKFYFFYSNGSVSATGFYKEDIPYGSWVYYKESMDTLKIVNYTSVWDYLQEDANFKMDLSGSMELSTKFKRNINSDGTFYQADIMPVFQDKATNNEFDKYVSQNLVYPAYAAGNGICGEVDVQFVIDREGKIRKPVVINPVNSDLNIEAIRVLTESPNWQPGYQENVAVNIKTVQRFRFMPWFDYAIKPNLFQEAQKPEFLDEEVFFIVEDMPKFNNGDPATEFRKFIFSNLRYPEIAAKKGMEGRVVLQFTVANNGEVKDAVVLVSAGPELDAEAVRVVTSSPLWTPGKQKGKPVNVLFTFPINFVIQ